jgi:MoaA/NifB/PqqE/SkfB family radical SAM enzyme
MEEIIILVKGLRQVRTHTISLVRGRLADGRHAEVDKAKYRRAVNLLEQGLRDRTLPRYRFSGARIKAAQDILQRRLIHQTMEEDRGLIPCFAGRLNLVLSERGDVSPCEIREEAFGNVRDHGYDLKRVLRTPAAREVLSSIRSGQCHCTHECYFMTNILFNPALYPAIAREYLRL